MPQYKKWFGRGVFFLFAFVFAALLWGILYLSLKSSPTLSNIKWLPSWLTAWADRYGEVRTLVPYFASAVLLAPMAFFLPGRPNVADLTVRRGLLSGRVIRVGAAGVFGLLVLTELIQRNLEQRVASWADIGWGTLGIILGVVSGIFCVCLIRVNRPS